MPGRIPETQEVQVFILKSRPEHTRARRVRFTLNTRLSASKQEVSHQRTEDVEMGQEVRRFFLERWSSEDHRVPRGSQE